MHLRTMPPLYLPGFIDMSRFKGGMERLFASLYDPVMWGVERWVFPAHRRYLLSDVSGDVLELGVGTGAMMRYYSELDGDVDLYGVEPNPHMLRRARESAMDNDVDIEIFESRAETLPFDDSSFDYVIASIVFCTIPDAEAAMAEAVRVLRQGGEFRFFEHVHGDGAKAYMQDKANPVWRRVAGNCHLNRDTEELIRDNPSMEIMELAELDMGVGLVGPFIRGRAVKR